MLIKPSTRPAADNAAMTTPKTERTDVALAVIGSGGAGVMTAGQILLDAAAQAGFHGLMTRSTGPQIRGGEAAALLRLGLAPVDCPADRIDLLLALDFQQAQRFADEIHLDSHSRVIADPAQGEVPEWIAASGAKIETLPLDELARSAKGLRANSIAAGLIAGLLGLEPIHAETAARALFAGKSERLIESLLQGLALGREQATSLAPLSLAAVDNPGPRWLITGNEAAAFGALAAGLKFCAAYPITPSTEIQEWLAGALPQTGGLLVQAEDELASINQCIGASFGGAPSMTATSGPGLSLMIEALGLASAAEIPLLVINVMRGGPSTGIPTKSEQSDLNLALFGAHGDVPRPVMAATSVADCALTAHWALATAEALQTPVIMLSDQFLGQARAAVPRPTLPEQKAIRLTAEPDETRPENSYRRFADAADGCSPMSLPGMPGLAYTATGLSHNEQGRPSTTLADHHRQLDKRRRKIEHYDYGDRWAEITDHGSGPPDTVLLCFGSLAGACRETAARRAADGHATRVIALRLVYPLQKDKLAELIPANARLLVVEQNHGGQLLQFLHGQRALPAHSQSLAQPGPLPIRPGDILQALSTSTEEAA
ncbi:MAG: 2-oxoacid:acceptor oxidoreductase subunit alpha [Wenzhouxiangella sp.]